MLGITDLLPFLLAGMLLNLTPGPDTMYILGKSLSGGKKQGIFSALGIGTGSLVHTFLAALGLSVILKESAVAFNAVKYVGAAYLIFLGIKALLASNTDAFDIQIGPKNRNGNVYLSGVLTNVLNPKVALFFMAFLPQFINPEYPHPMISFLLPGLLFTFTGTIWCLFLAYFSSTLTQKIQDNFKYKVWIDRITGLLFVSLGLKLAFSSRN